MKIYRDLSEIKNLQNPVVTTGTFDGVHVGHQKILQYLRQCSQQVQGESVVLTFWPHPRLVIFPDDNDLKLLSTLEEKAELLERYGVDHFVIYPFSQSFSRMGAAQYVQDILVDGIGVHTMAVGYDHRFGKNREGDFSQLQAFGKEFGFDVKEIAAKDVEDVNVSSTKVRNALLAGDVSTANTYLNYDYFITAKVVKGEGLGRKIGYPTANLLVEDNFKLIPKRGVYAVLVKVGDQTFKGMMNIGTRPTVSSKNSTSLEVHIFNFSGDLYTEEIRVSFRTRIRDEAKFDSVDALQAQLEKDKQQSLAILS